MKLKTTYCDKYRGSQNVFENGGVIFCGIAELYSTISLETFL